MRVGVPDCEIPVGEPWLAPTIEETGECHHNDPETHSRELCHMTKAQLRVLAQEHNVDGVKPTMRKEQIIELLEEAGL